MLAPSESGVLLTDANTNAKRNHPPEKNRRKCVQHHYWRKRNRACGDAEASLPSVMREICNQKLYACECDGSGMSKRRRSREAWQEGVNGEQIGDAYEGYRVGDAAETRSVGTIMYGIW
jgi:hypothetical protein